MASSVSGKYGTSVTRPEKRRLEGLQQLRVQRLGQAGRLGTGFRIGAELHDQVGAGVGGHQDHRVLEVDVAALAVAELPLSNTW